VLLNERGEQFLDSEFLVGVEPRRERRTEKNWFTLDCDDADKSHELCAGKSGKATITGALSTRSSAIFDLDNDGDLDIVTHEFNDRPQILISNLTEKKRIHYLKVQLIGTGSNRDGLGATVTVRVGGQRLTQFQDGKSGYLSQSSLPLYFGLGDATNVQAVEVFWPSGKRQALAKDLPIDGLLRIAESKD
jgi:enediyne biosynthesis protein E4